MRCVVRDRESGRLQILTYATLAACENLVIRTCEIGNLEAKIL